MTCWGKDCRNREDWTSLVVMTELETDQSQGKWIGFDLTFILKSTFTTFKCLR